MLILVVASFVLALAPQSPGKVRTQDLRIRPHSTVVHGRAGTLVLPGSRPATAVPAKAEEQQDPAAQGRSQEEFLKAVSDIRRSLYVPEGKEQAIVHQIGRTFDRVPERCLEAVRTADPDVVYGLMRVLMAVGQPEHARELEFLLLTRSFRNATEVVVATMAAIAREDARDRLFSCLTATRSAVRHHAALALEPRIRPEDADRLVLLSQRESGDVQLKALRLLGKVPPTPEVRARLVAALAEEPSVAEAAVQALVAQGPDAVEDLQAILRRPAVGRNSGYAALALASLEAANPGLVLVTEDMVGNLVAELDVPDPFQRAAVALALSGVAWRSGDITGERYQDQAVAKALLDVVAPSEFVAHLSTLKDLALSRLCQLVGQDFGQSQVAWREWWAQVASGTGVTFVGARRRVALTADNAAVATLTWRDADGVIVLRGERTAPPAAAADVFDHVVSAEELTGLVDELVRFGFMGDSTPGRRPPDARSLALAVDGAVAKSDAQTPTAMFDRMGARVQAVAAANRWQLYRDPVREPDAAAFWRAERRWLEQHPDAEERAERQKGRIVAAIPRQEGRRLTLAIDDLAAVPGLKDRISEADGVTLAEAARSAKSWDATTVRLLELAVLAPGDAVWRRVVDVARQHDEGGDALALRRVFGLIGPDRLIESLDSDSDLVRRVAMDEVSSVADLRATPKLIAAALDASQSIELRQTAVFALGRMRALDAREPLIAMLDQGGVEANLRRTTWVALARIGGDQVFPVLQAAFPSPEEADRRAVVQALGAMRDARAAMELGNIFSLRAGDTLGALALDQLRQLGDLLASPALTAHVDDRSDVVRQQCAMLLGEFANPAGLPELIAMLNEDHQRLRVVALLAGITGQDIATRNDRLDYLRAWYDRNRDRPQGDWLLQALTDLGVQHTLRREQLMPQAGTSAVPELTRLVMEVEQPWIRGLAARLLRVTTGEDFGVVTPLSTEAQRLAICDRYRFLHESAQAASGR